MRQEIVQTKESDTERAAESLCSKLKKPLSSYSIVIFFASSRYDFKMLSELLHEKFAKAEVIGSTTAGEITQDGFTKDSIVLNAIETGGSRTQCKGCLIDDAGKFPVVHKQELLQAAKEAGVNLSSPGISKNSFAISLISALHNAEENILSLVYTLVKDPDFMIAGASAGDDMKFKETFVSYNGRVSSDGAVLLFVRTQDPFCIYKENIFKESGKSVLLTDVDPKNHLVKSIDNQNPRRRYAQVLGISEREAEDATLRHPFGRVFGDNIFIASLARFLPDGTLAMYARVLQGNTQSILDPLDSVEITEKSCLEMKDRIRNPGCVIFFNCILRTIGFEKSGKTSSVAQVWKRHFPKFSGFSTYGEQIGHINSNQTLVALIIGE
ncbi:MAG: FIST C-terminal domain-containing protein [Treponema sp.]|nr:FIST C-terminal domain-containing protein [Treponema sp.]